MLFPCQDTSLDREGYPPLCSPSTMHMHSCSEHRAFIWQTLLLSPRWARILIHPVGPFSWPLKRVWWSFTCLFIVKIKGNDIYKSVRESFHLIGILRNQHPFPVDSFLPSWLCAVTKQEMDLSNSLMDINIIYWQFTICNMLLVTLYLF